MKVAFKNQAKEKANSNSCSVIEYPLNDPMLDIAIAAISGRYPENGRAVNQECQELAYVKAGEGKIVINGEEIPLTVGDSIIIDAGEPYYWEGSLELILSCRPAWTAAQHQQVD
ncbi:Cupin domain protein [Legionella massiliensis]|uniref:Cupin domain protein n=1 Tax=Legionella massiliensis TaxID=1034943 RepID=A0A078KWP0_9GAMM|nr:cupin domain-containing protein [Legionella massiliensis]CDZ76138.1 Cupin domain protein [Legionella massiliensis]CEE11876.1 Cupin domain protein [Legionella massiliensis]